MSFRACLLRQLADTAKAGLTPPKGRTGRNLVNCTRNEITAQGRDDSQTFETASFF